MDNLIYVVPAAGVVALLFAFWKATWVKKQDAGDETMQGIARSIQEGAMAFLAREYKVLSGFVVVVAVLLAVVNLGGVEDGTVAAKSPLIALSFIIGALASGLAGYIGMRVATNANVRTTQAAKTGLSKALDVAFSAGAVMGLSVVGLAIIGLGGLFIGYSAFWHQTAELPLVLTVLTGFSFGASSIALFARVGGGIYTKAADVGADLVGKVEAGLPEDDPRNPAVIADNVGDNVGDVAGMGADLFESFVGAIIGAMVLSLGFTVVTEGTGDSPLGPVILPLLIAAAGTICSMLGTFVVKTKEGGNPQHALDAGALGAAGVMAVVTFVLAFFLWPSDGATRSPGPPPPSQSSGGKWAWLPSSASRSASASASSPRTTAPWARDRSTRSPNRPRRGPPPTSSPVSASACSRR